MFWRKLANVSIAKPERESLQRIKQLKIFVKQFPYVPGDGKTILKKTLYNLADAVDIRAEGIGLYLSPP